MGRLKKDVFQSQEEEMPRKEITPHKVTKPIQLLAAWLVGLCIVDGSFLVTASALVSETLQTILIVAAVINVPLFIGAIFLLQTKFRPQMQEDSYYAKYLDKQTNQYVEISQSDNSSARFERLETEIRALSQMSLEARAGGAEEVKLRRLKAFRLGIAINDQLPWFSELRRDLKAEHFPVTSIFGSVAGTAAPDEFVIAIGNHLQGDDVTDLLRTVLKYKWDGVYLFATDEDPDPEDVYLGGYGYENRYAPITAELKELVEQGLDNVDLAHYVRMRLKEASQ